MNITSSSESIRKINAMYDGERVLQTDEIFEIKISYLWAIISCRNPFDSLDNTWIVKPYSGYIQNTRNIYNGVHMIDLRRGHIYNKHISEVDITIVMMKILSDLFKSVWKEILTVAKRKNQFDAFNDWKLIHVPEYYICIDESEDFYTILRYDNMP